MQKFNLGLDEEEQVINLYSDSSKIVGKINVTWNKEHGRLTLEIESDASDISIYLNGSNIL